MQNQTEQPITRTLEENYMPYTMSVIVSRAIPEIDGFKPSHRKLLYTMYKMGLLNGVKTKSANIVGQTMRLNPHGDMAIYETMVRLTRGHDALILPLVESKGNFGKHYSRDMAFAAPRYTEAKLDPVCAEIFADIDKDVVDFVDNYDGTMKEPTLLPTTFPNILVNPNQGIAVGMASTICSFNLNEICQTTIELIKNPDHNIMLTLTAPDFTTGGYLIYDREQLRQIYETGVGSFKVRAKYSYDKKANCIEITEIPFSTTVEAIIDKVVDLVKTGKIKEASYIRDETDINGMKIAIDLKRGADPDKLMQRLFKMTPLEDSFAANFNILIGGRPKTMGIKEILSEWIAFRTECIKRGLFYDIQKTNDRLHLLLGLQKILLDIDKAIKIVRETEEEDEVVPNLMIGFGIDEIQAEFVAEIKLRNLNREYILNKTAEIEKLKKAAEDMQNTLNSPAKLKKVIIDQLTQIMKKYGKPRKTALLYEDEIEEPEEEETAEDYPVTVFMTAAGYFKKITAQSLRMSGDHKLKEGDEIRFTFEATNLSNLLIFTDKYQVYKARVCDFDDSRTSVLGDFLPQKLGMDSGETPVFITATTDYKGYILAFFENGKCAKIEMASYETKTNRKKLINAYSDASPLVAFFAVTEEKLFVLTSSNGRCLIVDSGAISAKSTKNTAGVNVMTLKAKSILSDVVLYEEGMFEKPNKYRTKNIPAAGSFLKEDESPSQTKLI
jgi:DNA gyrase subunit A